MCESCDSAGVREQKTVGTKEFTALYTASISTSCFWEELDTSFGDSGGVCVQWSVHVARVALIAIANVM